MSKIEVTRMVRDERPTVGMVVVCPERADHFRCFSLEDRFRAEKVKGDTRIPEGVYPIQWRTVGRFARRWQQRGFPGSLQLMDVPGFEYVLIHAGNTKRDTEGCVLLGMGADLDARTISKSRIAVTRVYELVRDNPGAWQILIQ